MTPLQTLVKQLIKKYPSTSHLTYFGVYGIFDKAKKILKIKEDGWRMFFSQEIVLKYDIPDRVASIRGLTWTNNTLESFKQLAEITGINFV